MQFNSDQFVTQFFTTPTVAFAVGIFVIIYFIRRGLELQFKSLKTKVWWTELVLPAMPVVLSVVIALCAKKYPYPAVFAASTSGRIFFGLVCGVFTDVIYSKVQKVMGVFMSQASQSLPPPAPPAK
jgi:Kef-type K+ transport system membrane component KefB